MNAELPETKKLVVLVTPHFNLAATMAFLDPFRAANYLEGSLRFEWYLASADGGEVLSSSGVSVVTSPLTEVANSSADFVVVSSSWKAESYDRSDVLSLLVRWSKTGARIGGLDTGAFIIAKAGLFDGRKATVHYEHIDAFSELYPEITVTEDLFVFDGKLFSCCGGVASSDLALAILCDICGEGVSNSVARYLFHHNVRGSSDTQNPENLEPLGSTTPTIVRRAIDLMEANLEVPLPIPDLCQKLGISQRHLGRLFKIYVRKSPVLYYRDIRLDRARGLVTQTELKMSEIAVASGFANQVYFSRAYSSRFGLPPVQDRIRGRVPFQFRAWPMHSPKLD